MKIALMVFPVILMTACVTTGVAPTPAPADEPLHIVTASSFADPADVAAFRRCIALGKTDQQCFAEGDNGIGKWGDDTTQDTPICALPPEDWLAKWKQGSVAHGKRIEISLGNRTAICVLGDTMPAKAKITNGAGIDLNPAAAKALGLTPPFMQPNVGWRWAE